MPNTEEMNAAHATCVATERRAGVNRGSIMSGLRRASDMNAFTKTDPATFAAIAARQLIAEAILAATACPTCGRIHECQRFPTEGEPA